MTSVATAWLATARRVSAQAAEAGLAVELGVCQPYEKHAIVKQAGFQFLEETVGHVLMPKASDQEFEKSLTAMRAASVPVRACNIFIPGEMKLVGPTVDLDALSKYVEIVFRRAEKAGITRIVLGSSGARRIPEGLAPERARAQFVEFGRRIAPQAQAHGVIVVLEALNKGETNFINRVDEGLAIVDDVGHPSFQMHADIFHMLRENEGPESILKAGPRLRHCHVAEKKNRSAPGVEGDDFRPYFKALKAIGYKELLSIECNWKNAELELPGAHKVLREQLGSV